MIALEQYQNVVNITKEKKKLSNCKIITELLFVNTKNNERSKPKKCTDGLLIRKRNSEKDSKEKENYSKVLLAS